MCRLLAIRSRDEVDSEYHLDAFARLCRSSREYQGHGWGCAWIERGAWQRYRSLTPIWEDGFRPPVPVSMLIAHARSAFRDAGIAVENNMPFLAGDQAFVFNGELHGVRLAEEGRIGAEKLFNFLRRIGGTESSAEMRRALGIVRRRSARIRAMNFVIADLRRFLVHCSYDESPEYFTVHYRRSESTIVVCSEPYGLGQWHGLECDGVMEFGFSDVNRRSLGMSVCPG